jgi:gliding motility associated protien GldN
MKRILPFTSAIVCVSLLYAQPSNIQYDSRTIYTKQSIAERNPVAWPYLPERDVFICKHVERIIDTREKMNLCMKWPQQPLMEVIYKALSEGKIHAYKSILLDSAFTPDSARMIGSTHLHVWVSTGTEEGEGGEQEINSTLSAADFKKFKVMENWIFDRNTGTQYTRIYAIAPMYELKAAGISLGDQPAFYLSYQECRKLFVNTEVFNRQNDAGGLTFDDFFEQRLFSSYITKTSNAFDLSIRDMDEFHTDGVEALIEGNAQNETLFDTEHDMWEN